MRLHNASHHIGQWNRGPIAHTLLSSARDYKNLPVRCEMDQLYMLRAFVAAARYQSFSKAAESLNVTTGSISKAIAKLEGCIQTRVLLRTTRSVSLTDAAQP